jgi:lysophospholipase
MGFVATEGNPVPDGAQSLSYKGRAGVNLRALFAPSNGPVRGTIVLCPGRTEHVEKYFEVISAFQSRGFAVVAPDWRGQGLSDRLLSDPLKGHMESFDDAVSDLDILLRSELASKLPRPWIIVAHSMGGAISLRALQTRRVEAEGAFFSAPMWGLKGITAGQATIIKFLSSIGLGGAYAPGRRSVRPGEEPFENNALTHDAARFARNQGIMKAEPRLALGHPTIGWVAAGLRAIESFLRPGALQHLRLPVLVLSAEEEMLVDNQSHADIASFLPNARHQTVSGARHELLQEVNSVQDIIWRAFDEFAEKIAPPRIAA